MNPANPHAPPARTGWRIAATALVVGVLMNLLARGLAESFAVFLLPLGETFRADRASITSIYSIYILVYGLAAPFSGMVIDRLGVRVCYAFGLVAFAAAYFLAARATQLWHLHLLLGGCAGIASSALGMVPASMLASRWFDRRLPTAMSVLYASLGTGALLFSPLGQWLIDGWGWRGAYRWLAAVPVALMPLIFVLPWRRILAGEPALMERRAARRRTGLREALRIGLASPSFWALAGVLFFTSMTTYAVMVQLVAFLVESGFAPLLAASIYGLVGMLSLTGVMGAGLAAERFGERRVATVSYACTIAGIGCLALLSASRSTMVLGAFAVLFGTMSGSRGPLVAVLSSRLFPGPAQATIYGFVLTGMGLGGGLGAWLGGVLLDRTGNYLAGFALAAAAAFAGLLVFRSIESIDPASSRTSP